MKKLLFLLLLPLAAFAQNTKVVPDCVIPFNFTTTASTSNLTCGAPNGSPNSPGIASWIVVYDSTGFSAVSLVVQSAPDSAGAPGTWVTFAGTVLSNTQYPGSSGINPNTATTSAFTGFAGYYPWMRVTLASISGTGRIKGNLYGFLNSTLARAGSGGGGGGGPTIAGTTNQIAVSGAGCTTPSTATCTISLPNASVTIDPSTGNFSTPGSVTSGSGSGVAGIIDLAQGTAPSIPANSFGFEAPTAITTSEYLQPPNAVPAAHSTLIVDAPTSNVSPFHYKVIPDCQDSGGNHLNFTQSSDAYSCGTSGGGGGTPGSTLFSSTSSATVTATSATTLIGTVTGSTTIPANTFAVGQYFQVIGQGYYSTPATPVSLTINLNIGGTTRLTTGAVAQLASVTTGTWRLSCGFTTRTTGASGTQIANCIFEETGPTLTPGESPLQTSSTWTIDTTATQIIDVTATWSTATGAPTITGTNVVGFIPGAAASGGGGSTRGLFASRPFCSTSGSTYFSTDIPVTSECNGSTWADWAYGIPVTLPSATSFTARNSVVLTTNGFAYLSSPSSTPGGYGEDIALPATPYSVWVGFNCNPPQDSAYCALYILNATGTAGVTYGFKSNAGFQTAHFSNWNTLGGGIQDSVVPSSQNTEISRWYIRLVDNGTNFTFYSCTDKVAASCFLSSTQSRTANLSNPGFVGFWTTPSNGGNVSNLTVFDFTVTSP